jgi:hypothetical protein
MKTSRIYSAFSLPNVVLCLCGFHFNGMDSSARYRYVLSALYSIGFLLLFALNVVLGEQEPQVTKSLLLRHGFHKLYLLQFLYLSALVWNNFYYRREIEKCLRTIEEYDVLCEVRTMNFPSRKKEEIVPLQLQHFPALNIKINHRQHHKKIIVGLFLSFLLKAVVSLLALTGPGERDEVHLVALFSYVLGNDVTAIIFILHFTFLIANLEQRLGNYLHSFRRWSGRCERMTNEIGALEAYCTLYDLFVVLIDLINLIFRLQVIAHSL